MSFNKKSVKLILLTPLVFFFIYRVYEDIITTDDKIYQNNMTILYSKIDGKIFRIENNHSNAMILLHNKNEEFWIGEIILENGEEVLFLDIAQKGDRIYSPYSSDSIYITRNNKTKGYRIKIYYE